LGDLDAELKQLTAIRAEGDGDDPVLMAGEDGERPG
jgi:hypothetical protein